ncbi:MAG TPA: hypothetical protein VGL63_07650 [Streptosporangiaceae bacterium]|jgi:hypothetical protein
MRVYLPSTMPALAAVLRAGEIGPAPLAGFAVTPMLREWYASGDLQELEYAALAVAAKASLRLIAADPAVPARRVTLAVEIPDDQVSCCGGMDDPAAVRLSAAAPVARLASAHVDGEDAVADVRAAAAALDAADSGDEDASFTVDGAEGHELLWYAAQELPYLFG